MKKIYFPNDSLFSAGRRFVTMTESNGDQSSINVLEKINKVKTSDFLDESQNGFLKTVENSP